LIDIDYKLDFHKRANVYVKGRTRLAIEYVANPMAYLQWLEKNESYINHDIIPLWVLSRNKFDEMSHNDYNFFEMTTALTNKDGILFTLNTDDGDLSLAKYMTYKYKDEVYKRKIFKEKIQLSKMVLDDNNEFDVTYFLKAYNEAYQSFKDKIDKEIEEKEKLEQKAQEKEKKAQEVREKYRTDDNTSRSIDEKWGTCKYCGRYTNKWRAYLGDGVVICYCDED